MSLYGVLNRAAIVSGIQNQKFPHFLTFQDDFQRPQQRTPYSAEDPNKKIRGELWHALGSELRVGDLGM